MKHKVKIAVFAVLLALLLALAVFLCVWFLGADYSAFDAATRTETAIPGLKSGFSPQGLCPVNEDSGYRFAMSGYVKGKPSRVYFFGSGTSKYITLRDENGELSTHFGGITNTGNYLVVASGKKLVRVSLADALAAEDGGAVKIKDSFEIADFRSIAYCYYHGGMLYAGEFYRPGNYETDQSHHIAVADGETNYGIVYAFTVNEAAEGGVVSFRPNYAISVREQVQGIAVWDNGVALSTSYGLPDSRLWVYSDPLYEQPVGDLGGVPLYVLGEHNLTATFDMPCMSEEIFEQDGRIYILFESGCNQYKQFVRRQIANVLSTPVNIKGVDE